MRREIIPYNPKLKELAKKLRQNMTLSEVLLWDELKQKKIKGYDFDRQRPMDEFIVDFYCKDLKLAIEIDGDSHNHAERYKADKKRQKQLEDLGVRFLRFHDKEVKKDMNNVIRTIEYWIEEEEARNEEPTPTPPKRGVDRPQNEDLAFNSRNNYPNDIQFPSKEGLGVGSLGSLLEIAKNAALEAGKEILQIYESGDFTIEAKSDESPLTLADKAAHNKIVDLLEKTNIPILSEEGKQVPYEERSKWEYFWMVDPLDGTKEFIKKNGEFTVNIALIHQSKAVLGVVYPPVIGELYWAIENNGAYRMHSDGLDKLETTKKALSESGIKVVASRSHMSERTEEYLSQFENADIVSKGSSLKFLLVASGEADVYPRFAPTMEWDTAAAHIIVSEAGGTVVLTDGVTPLSYNKQSLLNPSFIALPT